MDEKLNEYKYYSKEDSLAIDEENRMIIRRVCHGVPLFEVRKTVEECYMGYFPLPGDMREKRNVQHEKKEYLLLGMRIAVRERNSYAAKGSVWYATIRTFRILGLEVHRSYCGRADVGLDNSLANFSPLYL